MVIDDASGGCFDFQWLVPGEAAHLEAICKQMPPSEFDGMSVPVQLKNEGSP
jgi:hypothetical protein